MSAQELMSHILQLPTAERAQLAAEILESLPADATFDVDDQEWMAEIRSRREEVLKGHTVMRDWSDVRAEMLTELASPRSA